MTHLVDPDLLEVGDRLDDVVSLLDGVHPFESPLDPGGFPPERISNQILPDAPRLDVEAARLAADARIGLVPPDDAGQRAVPAGSSSIVYSRMTSPLSFTPSRSRISRAMVMAARPLFMSEAPRP